MSGTTGSPQEKKPIEELENWNTDRTVTPYTMVRGNMVKRSGAWVFDDGFNDRFWFDVTRGSITGMSRFAYGGNITDLTVADGIRDIWNGPGKRTKLSDATTLYISSTDAGDNGLIAVEGLDTDYNAIIALGTLNGQNQVQLSADIWKVSGAFVLGTGTVNGTIYIAETDSLTGGVPDTDSKIQLTIDPDLKGGAIANKTVPAGYTLYVRTLKITPNKGKDVTVYLAFESATQARVINPSSFELFQYNFDTVFEPVFTIEEKTDLMFLAKTTDTNVTVSVLVEGVLVQN